jgi:hypothetical protein
VDRSDIAADRRRIRRLRERQDDAALDDYAFDGLHLLAAGLYTAAGAESALGERRGDQRGGPIRLAPLATAPLAAVAHIVRGLRPGLRTRKLARALDGAAMLVGVVGTASSIFSALVEEDDPARMFAGRRSFANRIPSLAPLSFGIIGAFGVLLDRAEHAEAKRLAKLERRARIADRLLPARRTKRLIIEV